MKSTVATIIGTAALGLLKEKLGSSAKIKKQQLKLIDVPAMWMRTYATNLDYLGININDLNDTDPDQLNRLFLFPIENSSTLKSAGLFLDGIDISDEDENLGDLYSVFWSYVIEPYDENLVLNQETIEHIRDRFKDLCFAFNEAEKKVMADDVAYDDGGEFSSGNVEEFIEYKGDQLRNAISSLRFISIPIFTIEKNGKKIKLNEYNPIKKKPKLRRR